VASRFQILAAAKFFAAGAINKEIKEGSRTDSRGKHVHGRGSAATTSSFTKTNTTPRTSGILGKDGLLLNSLSNSLVMHSLMAVEFLALAFGKELALVSGFNFGLLALALAHRISPCRQLAS